MIRILRVIDNLASVFEMCLKSCHLDPVKFLQVSGLAWQAASEKTEAKLELLIDIYMLLTVEKDIREGICNPICQYSKANNKYMNDCDKNEESPYLKYRDVNNLCGQAMSEKLAVNKFEYIEHTSQFNRDFIKSYNEASHEGYSLEVDVQYSEKLHKLHNDLPFLTERMKLEKVEKLAANLHDKSEYVIHIAKLKQTLDPELILKKNQKMIKFSQKPWLKPYIGMNTTLIQKSKNNFEKDFLQADE